MAQFGTIWRWMVTAPTRHLFFFGRHLFECCSGVVRESFAKLPFLRTMAEKEQKETGKRMLYKMISLVYKRGNGKGIARETISISM